MACRTLAELRRRLPDLETPFPGSPFTTSEISFCDTPILSRKNRRSVFYFVEAMTALGDFNDQTGGQLTLSEDENFLQFGPGMTAVFPAGTTEYMFAAVGKGEKRYMFRQYFCAGVHRWIEKGGRTDKEFAEEAPEQEVLAWEEMRLRRAEQSAKMFTKLQVLEELH
ncbi:hypothetical protein R3P38DRAFT_2561333 [Favolaschia claudopus]|uniref:Uncharacterized protein n=1 Tax=Favolaschia claudopus TaxID=2862362 RepID=A0AAW0A4B2_9AGAR